MDIASKTGRLGDVAVRGRIHLGGMATAEATVFVGSGFSYFN